MPQQQEVERQPLLPFAEDLSYQSSLPLGQKTDAQKESKDDPRNARIRKLLYSGLVYYEHKLGHQEHGMAMEGGSDSPAMYAAATKGNAGDFISTGFAVILIGLMERQRRAMKRDLKHILEIWIEFQKDRLSESKDARRTAYDNLEKRMRESGILFEKLPEHDPQDFNAGKFKDLARAYKILPESMNDDTHSAKKKSLRDHWIGAGNFMGEALTLFVNAPANLLNIPFMRAAKGSVDHFRKYKLTKSEAKDKHRILNTKATTLDLSKVTVNSMEVLHDEDHDPEMVHELIATRDSVVDLIGQDKQASILFLSQTAFMLGQLASLADNVFVKQDGGAAAINIACMNMASVALEVLAQNKVHFGEVLEGERAKMSTQFDNVVKTARKKNANDNSARQNIPAGDEPEHIPH